MKHALALAAVAGVVLSAPVARAEEPASPAISGTLYAAVTGPTGELVGGVGVKKVTYPVDGDGSFKVTFKKNVDQCLLQATSSRFQFSVEAAPFFGDKKSVYVFMHNSSGQGGPGAFYLTVLCP